MPSLRSISHVSLSVRNVEAASAWYQGVFRDPDNIQLELHALPPRK